MVRRLLPLVLAVIVGAAPVARELCQISCAELSASSPSSSHHHHGADQAADHAMPGHAMGAHASGSPHEHAKATLPASEHSLLAVAHGCEHGDGWAPASAPASRPLLAAPTIVTSFDDVLPPVHTVPFASAASRSRPPIPLSLRAPLRV